MPVTKPEGLLTLIKTNIRRHSTKPKDQDAQQLDEHNAHATELGNIPELLTEAQCSMFSQIGIVQHRL